MRTALDLKKGETGSILSFLDMKYATKLVSMGLVPSSRVKMIRKSPLGQCLYFKMENQYIALRKNEAASIQLEH